MTLQSRPTLSWFQKTLQCDTKHIEHVETFDWSNGLNLLNNGSVSTNDEMRAGVGP